MSAYKDISNVDETNEPVGPDQGWPEDIRERIVAEFYFDKELIVDFETRQARYRAPLVGFSGSFRSCVRG